MSYDEHSRYVNVEIYGQTPTTVEEHRAQAIAQLQAAPSYNTNTEACIAAAEVHVRLAELIVAERAASAAEQTAEALTRLAEQATEARQAWGWFRRHQRDSVTAIAETAVTGGETR